MKRREKNIEHYIIVNTLSKTSFGKVLLAKNSINNEFYAIKLYKKSLLNRRKLTYRSKQNYNDVLREISILQKLNHKNIVKFEEAINDENDDYIYIVMEYISGRSLLKNPYLSEYDTRRYFKDILCGLKYIHQNNIIHRDIKPENILITGDRKTAKICDFSISQEFDISSDVVHNSFGSPSFLAPELIFNISYSNGREADIWSLGVTLYFMVFRDYPFHGNDIFELFENIKTKEISFPIEISSDLKDLLKRMLEKEPSKRITIEEIEKHAWVVNEAVPTSS